MSQCRTCKRMDHDCPIYPPADSAVDCADYLFHDRRLSHEPNRAPIQGGLELAIMHQQAEVNG